MPPYDQRLRTRECQDGKETLTVRLAEPLVPFRLHLKAHYFLGVYPLCVIDADDNGIDSPASWCHGLSNRVWVKSIFKGRSFEWLALVESLQIEMARHHLGVEGQVFLALHFVLGVWVSVAKSKQVWVWNILHPADNYCWSPRLQIKGMFRHVELVIGVSSGSSWEGLRQRSQCWHVARRHYNNLI